MIHHVFTWSNVEMVGALSALWVLVVTPSWRRAGKTTVMGDGDASND